MARLKGLKNRHIRERRWKDMIPDIGLMVGSYAVVRLVSLITRGGDRAENIVVRLLAGLAIGVTLISLADILLKGTK